MPEPTEIQLARIQEQMKTIISSQEFARATRMESDKEIKEIHKLVSKLDHRVGEIEKHVATATPTLSEFNTLKYKIQGAGTFGKWIWAIAAGLVGFLLGFTNLLKNLF